MLLRNLCYSEHISWPFYPWDELDGFLVLEMDAVFQGVFLKMGSPQGRLEVLRDVQGWRHLWKKGFIHSLCLLGVG